MNIARLHARLSQFTERIDDIIEIANSFLEQHLVLKLLLGLIAVSVPIVGVLWLISQKQALTSTSIVISLIAGTVLYWLWVFSVIYFYKHPELTESEDISESE